jgi:hypothetical protein
VEDELEKIVIEKGVLLFDKQYKHQRLYENTLDRMSLGDSFVVNDPYGGKVRAFRVSARRRGWNITSRKITNDGEYRVWLTEKDGKSWT